MPEFSPQKRNQPSLQLPEVGLETREEGVITSYYYSVISHRPGKVSVEVEGVQ